MSIRPVVLAALVLAAFVSNASAQVFPDSSERFLSPGELRGLDCEALWLARNEIYARNGYIFRTTRGRAVFGDGGYTSHPRLNAPERANVALIERAEQRARCR